MKQYWDIKDKEKPIIEASLIFGDYLYRHPLTMPRQQEIIIEVQNVLRLLPKFKPGFNGSFECIIDSVHPETEGVFRVWSVDFFNGVFEIGSAYTPYPEVDEFEQVKHESSYEIEFGHSTRVNYGMDTWCKEITKIETFLSKDYYLEIETFLGEEHVMSDKVLLNGNYISSSDLPFNSQA